MCLHTRARAALIHTKRTRLNPSLFDLGAPTEDEFPHAADGLLVCDIVKLARLDLQLRNIYLLLQIFLVYGSEFRHFSHKHLHAPIRHVSNGFRLVLRREFVFCIPVPPHPPHVVYQ